MQVTIRVKTSLGDMEFERDMDEEHTFAGPKAIEVHDQLMALLGYCVSAVDKAYTPILKES